MNDLFILFIATICGLFSGFGTGIRYGFLDTDKNENDLKKISDSIFKLFSYNDQAGAILLGVKKIVVKVHGKANRLTISSAINQLIALNDGGYNNK